MEKKENKWLLRKLSGSRGKYSHKPDYSDTRNQKSKSGKTLPFRESMSKNKNSLDTTLVKKWLYSQVGINFDLVYSEFLTRIQPKYLDAYRDCIFKYVHRSKDLLYDSNSNIITPSSPPFFINPIGNILEKYSELEAKKIKGKKLESILGTFYFSYEKKTWEIFGPPTIIVKGNSENLTKEKVKKIASFLKKLSKLKEKANQEINDYALKREMEKVLNSRKEIFSIQFYEPKNINKFYILFEIAIDNRATWKVVFNNFEIEKIER